MIETKPGTNYLMNWDDPKDRINYFRNLREFLSEVEKCHDFQYFGGDEELEKRNPGIRQSSELLKSIFKKWNVYFIDIPGDPMPRVNLDEPKGG